MTRTIFSRPFNPARGRPPALPELAADPGIDAVGGAPKPVPEPAKDWPPELMP
jgi:hypothetical protein